MIVSNNAFRQLLHLWIGIVYLLIATSHLAADLENSMDQTIWIKNLNNKEDVSKIVQNAIEQAKATGAKKIIFEPGTYHFYAGAIPEHPNTAIHIAELNGVDIDGNGSEFIFHGLTGCFEFVNCTEVILKNFSVDWERPCFSVGTVLASEPLFFDVEIFDEYPVEGGEPVVAFMDFDPQTRLPRRPAVDSYYNVDHTELIRPQVLRVHLKSEVKLEPGVWAVLRHYVYERTAILMSSSKHMKVENVTLYTAPGMGFIAGDCEDVTLDRYQIRKKGDRIFSVSADGSHFAGCTGPIRIKDCFFEGMGDDAVNIKSGLYLSIRERIDDYTLLGEHNLKMNATPKVGELMEFSHVEEMIPYATLEVKEVSTERNPETNEYKTKITFKEPLPKEAQLNDVLGNVSRLAQVHISGCHVKNNRPRGFLLQTRNLLIEDNSFEGCLSSGIFVIADVTYFFESISAYNLIIRNNKFIDCNRSLVTEGALAIVTYLNGYVYPQKPGVFKNIIIDGNTFENTNENAIFVGNAENVIIRNNKITGSSIQPLRNHSDSAIQVYAGRNFIIENNEIEASKQGEGFKEAVFINDLSETKTIIVRNNIGF